jgi:excisionase family DNA binding protein
MEKKLYTVQEAAEILNLSRSTLYVLLKKGAISSVKIGGSRRFTYSAIQSFVDQL